MASPASSRAVYARKPPGSACLPCRKLKMRCEQRGNRPCNRCRKANRSCVMVAATSAINILSPQSPSTTRLERSSSPGPRPPELARPIELPRSQLRSACNGWTSNSLTSAPSNSAVATHSVVPACGSLSGENPPSLSGIYSTPPLSTVTQEIEGLDNSKIDSGDPRLPDDLPGDQIVDGLRVFDKGALSRRDKQELITIFNRCLLDIIPVFNPEDFADIDHILDHYKDLTNCICFVTARIVPGYKRARVNLCPSIERFVRESFNVSRDCDNGISDLQALIILYGCCQQTPIGLSGSSPHDEPNYFFIKSAVENLALQLALHRSIELLGPQSSSGQDEGSVDSPVRLYTYWLWLYTMAHHVSVFRGIPPSIREDDSIRRASDILKDRLNDPRRRRLLGEVELCLLWEKLRFHNQAVEEWWCNPTFLQSGETSFEAVMNDMDALLDEWRQRWSRYFTNGKWGEALDFHYCFTKFCLSTYFIRTIRPSFNDLSALHRAAVNKCVHFASDALLVVIGLGPVARKKLQDIGHAIFIMISYCCLFILQAHTLLGTLDTDDILELVRSVAELMIDTASHSNDTSLTYGKAILQRAEMCKHRTSCRLTGDAERLVANNSMGANEWDPNLEGVRWATSVEPEFSNGDDSMFNNLFDFSAAFSELFQNPAA